MTSEELIELFRDEVSDLAEPYLWSDRLLYRYLNEAQEMFCRDTFGIADSSTVSVCRLAVEPDVDWYALSPKVLKVRSATRADTGRPLRLLNAEKAPQEGVLFDGRPGPLSTLVQGLEKSRLRAWPMPSETITVNLSVFRLPLETLSEDNNHVELEIDSQHHVPLMHWMKYRAYAKDDVETMDLRKSEKNFTEFKNYCSRAKDEQSRAMRDTGVVAYGGL